MNQYSTTQIRQITSNVDTSLTPKNAKERGYKYIDDVIYDPNLKNESLMDIFELINNEKCKFGSPSEDHDEPNIYLGIYMQIKQ